MAKKLTVVKIGPDTGEIQGTSGAVLWHESDLTSIADVQRDTLSTNPSRRARKRRTNLTTQRASS